MPKRVCVSLEAPDDVNEAIEAASDALGLDPTNPLDRVVAAVALAEAGYFTEAEARAVVGVLAAVGGGDVERLRAEAYRRLFGGAEEIPLDARDRICDRLRQVFREVPTVTRVTIVVRDVSISTSVTPRGVRARAVFDVLETRVAGNVSRLFTPTRITVELLGEHVEAVKRGDAKTLAEALAVPVEVVEAAMGVRVNARGPLPDHVKATYVAVAAAVLKDLPVAPGATEVEIIDVRGDYINARMATELARAALARAGLVCVHVSNGGQVQAAAKAIEEAEDDAVARAARRFAGAAILTQRRLYVPVYAVYRALMRHLYAKPGSASLDGKAGEVVAVLEHRELAGARFVVLPAAWADQLCRVVLGYGGDLVERLRAALAGRVDEASRPEETDSAL